MSEELIPLTAHEPPITYLPRFTTDLPFFYLTNKRETLAKNIDFRSTDSEGRPIRWKVIPNRDSAIGVPSVEAHEVWIKLIKPSIDRGRGRREGKIYSITPLASIRQCLRSLGWDAGGWQQEKLLRCIRQIGYTACEADFWLPTTTLAQGGKPLYRHVKGAFNRMSLYAIGSKHVTEEELKSKEVDFDFDLEDTVYIQLHPLEVLIQQSQPQRPTDNEYLFSVSPAERRWLELLQPFFFGVTNNPHKTRGYCEIRYSWYVKHHHTLTRQTERRRVVEQMNRLITDHKQFGYVAKVEYLPVYDKWFGGDRQVIDYVIRYYPGKGAVESNKRIKARIKEIEQRDSSQLTLNFMPPGPTRDPESKGTPEEKTDLTEDQQELLARLLNEGLFLDTAEALVREKPEEVRRQLDFLVFRTSNINRAGLLRLAIEQGWPEPDGYRKARRKQAKIEISEEARRIQEEQIKAEMQAEQEAERRAEEQLAALSPEAYAQLYAEAKSKLHSLLKRPHLKAELDDATNEHWQRTIRAAMIRKLQNS